VSKPFLKYHNKWVTSRGQANGGLWFVGWQRGAAVKATLGYARHDLCLIADFDDMSVPHRLRVTEAHFLHHPSHDWVRRSLALDPTRRGTIEQIPLVYCRKHPNQLSAAFGSGQERARVVHRSTAAEGNDAAGFALSLHEAFARLKQAAPPVAAKPAGPPPALTVAPSAKPPLSKRLFARSCPGAVP
jgi:hypothetical protein